MSVNVNRDNPDQFYRYKMPLLIAKVEGKGNGIKTVIVNMVEVGKALGRPPSYPCKYFGCELGAQTQMDHKIGRYIVNGAHEGPKLQDMLDGFIKKFVLCPECENPETELHVQVSKGRITQTCKACGHHGVVDPRHRLTTFIIKNPPNAGEDSAGKKGDKKSRRAEKQKGKKKDDDGGKLANNHSNHTPSSPTVVDGNHQDGDPRVADVPPISEENGDDDWSVDTSEEAVKARTENLSEHVSALALSGDAELTANQRLDKFFKFVESMKQSGGTSAISANIPKIKAEAEKLEVSDKAAGILAEVLYTDQLQAEIKQYRPIMLHFVVENRKAQRLLLICFEKLVEKYEKLLLPKAAVILKTFYDEDILEEEAILEWANKASKKHVNEEVAKQIHEKVAPVIQWLRTAEEESDEEEDDDEDVEVVYSEKVSKLTTETVQVENGEDDGDDLDIDAI